MAIEMLEGNLVSRESHKADLLCQFRGEKFSCVMLDDLGGEKRILLKRTRNQVRTSTSMGVS